MTRRTAAITTLLVLGITACIGGTFLTIDPSGDTMGLPLSLLDETPFETYRLPGIILFVVLGADSMIAALFVWRQMRGAAGLVIVQGAALTIWIVVQIMMIGPVHALQAIYLLIGILLLALGWKMWGK